MKKAPAYKRCNSSELPHAPWQRPRTSTMSLLMNRVHDYMEGSHTYCQIKKETTRPAHIINGRGSLRVPHTNHLPIEGFHQKNQQSASPAHRCLPVHLCPSQQFHPMPVPSRKQRSSGHLNMLQNMLISYYYLCAMVRFRRQDWTAGAPSKPLMTGASSLRWRNLPPTPLLSLPGLCIFTICSRRCSWS